MIIRLQLPKSASDRAALEPARDMVAGLYQAALDRVREVFAETAAAQGTG